MNDPLNPGRRVDSFTLRLDADRFDRTAEIDLDAPGVSVSFGRTKEGRAYRRVTVKPPGLPGVNGLSFDGLSDALTLDGSAKALLGDYGRGIGWDTVEPLAAAFNRVGLVHVTPEGLLSASVKAADVFVDVDPRENVGGVYATPEAAVSGTFDALRSLRSNLRFRMENGHRPVDPSLRFESARIRGKDVLATYAKGPELLEARNADLLRLAPRIYNELAGRVRFERRARGPSLVKRFCDRGIRDPYATLADVLTSDARPVSSLFLDVRGEVGQRDLFDTLERMLDACPLPLGADKVAAWRWLESEGGRWFILESVGWNLETLRQLTLRVIGPSNASKVRAEYADRIAAAARGDTNDKRARTAARLDRLAQALREAEDRGPIHSLPMGSRSGRLVHEA